MKNPLHRIFSLLLSLTMALLLAVPAWAVEPDGSGLSLSQTSATLPVGGTLALTVTLPEGDSGKTVKWTSSAPKVASVSKTGEVSALAEGKAEITASADGKTAVCSVTVEKNYVVDVSISPLSPGTLCIGETSALSAYVTYQYKTDSDGIVTWTTTDSTVATVSADGLVSALAKGKALIYATARDKSRSGINVSDVYKLTVLAENGDPGKDQLVLNPATTNTTGSPTLPMTLHAPQAFVMNGNTNVTDRFTITYLWSYSGKTYAGGDSLTFQPLDDSSVICHITAISNTDDTHILTADGVYNIELYSGVSAEGVTSLSEKDVTLGALVGGAENRSLSEQLLLQSPGLVSVSFDPATISGDDVGSLVVQGNVPYSLNSQGDKPFSAIVFSPSRPGEYSIGFTALDGENTPLYGRMKITVTGTAPQETLASIPCESDGIPMTSALTVLAPTGDPAVAMSFGTPKNGLLLRDFSYGTGLRSAGERFYLADPSCGQFPLSSLTYLPKAGFSGTEYLPVTVITQNGRSLQETLPIEVRSKTSSEFFGDVTAQNDGVWSSDAVDFAYACGLMNGTDPGLFSLNEVMSRCMLVTVLYRMEGSPAVTGTAPYQDLDTGAYYYDAVRWASSNGIVNGDDLGNFRPEDPLTREQLATILYRYAGFKGQDTDYTRTLEKYRDAPSVSNYAINAMSWAVERGIISGTSDMDPTLILLAPQESATRAQVAVMLHRFLTL